MGSFQRDYIWLLRRKSLLIDGSFVTHKISPGDVDSVILLPDDFSQQLANGSQPAIELERMLITNQPEEIYAAEDILDWQEWVDFFSRTRRLDGAKKGLVEVQL